MKMTHDGIELSYRDEGSGPPIVLIHGFPLSSAAWSRQIEPLRTRFRVIAPDLRGFGDSAATPGPTTMDRFAGDIKDLLDQLNLRKVVLAGHSMGGYIALAFARQYPGMLNGLALVATRSSPDSSEAAAGRKATAEKVRHAGTGVVIDAMAPKMVADQRLLPDVRAMMQSAKPDGVIGALLGMADRPDATSDLPKLPMPAWIVTGDRDILIPKEESEKMAALIPGSTLTIIPGAGHLVAYEQPETFNAACGHWLDSIN